MHEQIKVEENLNYAISDYFFGSRNFLTLIIVVF